MNELANKQTDLDEALDRISPDKRAAFLRCRLRLNQLNENDEVLAMACYLDAVAVLINDLTKDLSSASLKTIFDTEIKKIGVEVAKHQRPIFEATRAIEKAADKLSRQHDELIAKLPDVHKASEIIRGINHNLFQWAIVASFFVGIIATLGVEHLLLHR